MRFAPLAFLIAVALACGDDGAPTDDDVTTGDSGPGTNLDGGPSPSTASCFRFVDGILVFEAESLPLVESWEVRTAESGFSGGGYIVWTGDSHNNDPTHGQIDITLEVEEAGRYQLTWRTRIGMGGNTTEHNDTWVRFPDADDYYGLKGSDGAEVRRYPNPICEDADAMAAIVAMDGVDTADCVRGSTRDGWLKVYSSGANDWKWSARTSDNDASTVTIEVDAPGTYTMQLAARADFSLIDRIVLHREGLSNDAVQDLSLSETRCE